MNTQSHARFFLLTSGIWLLASGCSLPDIQQAQPDAMRYYVLSARRAAIYEPGPHAPRLAVRRVELPDYLKNRALALRRGENEVKLADDARWAEPLEAGIGRVVLQRLADKTGVYGLPSSDTSYDYEVSVRVLNCEGMTVGNDSRVSFAAEIEIKSTGPAAAVVAHQTFTAKPAAWDGKDYGQLAGALSQAVVELADAVLAAVPEKK